MSYDSKYTGKQVEELLDQVPNKVDKVDGKQLSTEDFTTALKNKLDGLSNYDDSEISEAVEKLRSDFDTLVSGDSTTAIKTFNEIIAFLSGIEDSESLDSIIASIEQQIAGKQDTIADLATIREGAGKGATAVQPSSLAKVATSGNYADLSGKPAIPTTLAGLTDDSTHRTVTDTEKATWNAKSNFSGSYNDLANKPTIPAAVTVDTALSATSTNPVQNKAVTTGINAKYTKPSTGIPESDLAAAVRASLGKADTALQNEQYKGTVTGVKINGSTKNPSNGVVDLGTVVTDVTGKQDKLVSGTNIKTINNQSILGSGNITISGGGSSDKVEVVGIYPVVNGTEWTYQIPAGKFVELAPADGTTVPSYIHFELLDPVEGTLGSGDGWTAEYSKYHFVLTGLGVLSPWGFGTNTYQNVTPFFYNNFASVMGTTTPPPCAEFDVLCSLVHSTVSTGNPDLLYGYITMAPLYN